MPCLVCGNTVPLLRQLAGSQFCSDEHSRLEAGSPAVAVLRSEKSTHQLHPARFAIGAAVPALIAGHPDSQALGGPIPSFCDLILSRRSRKNTMGPKCANTVSWPVCPAAPGAARTVLPAQPENSARLNL